MRQSWTDDRLDDLSHRMDERFDRVEGEMKAGFERVDGEMKAGFKRVDGEIATLREGMASCETKIERIAAGQSSMREAIAELHADNRQLRSDVSTSNAQLSAQLHAFQRTMVQVVGGLAVGLLALLGVLVAQL
jgi:septal ring factor EnvC (AmiA/AmiB activator)